jgi:hypothetical protein
MTGPVRVPSPNLVTGSFSALRGNGREIIDGASSLEARASWALA